MNEHSELAYSWPALVFAIGLIFAMWHAITGDDGWVQTAGLVAIGATFFPCCIIRDWWVSRESREQTQPKEHR